MIKLNGGLGTSMGMTEAKSLLEVKDGLTFLDIIVRQSSSSAASRRPPPAGAHELVRDPRRDAGLPAERYPSDADVREFLQNKEPKLLVDDLTPAEWPADPELEWAPPGHGDIYVALQASGMLRSLLDDGYEAAFVSNSDNLGAVLDPNLASVPGRRTRRS